MIGQFQLRPRSPTPSPWRIASLWRYAMTHDPSHASKLLI